MNKKIPKLVKLKKSKIRTEIHEKEMKERITVKTNKTKSWLFLWEDKLNWQTFSQTHQEKKRRTENPKLVEGKKS